MTANRSAPDPTVDYPKVGDRVLLNIGPHWDEPGTVTAIDGKMATVQIDETIEVPAHLGGGWLLIVDREIETLGRMP